MFAASAREVQPWGGPPWVLRLLLHLLLFWSLCVLWVRLWVPFLPSPPVRRGGVGFDGPLPPPFRTQWGADLQLHYPGGFGKEVRQGTGLDCLPSSRAHAAGDRQLDPGPTEVPAAGDCQLGLGPTEQLKSPSHPGGSLLLRAELSSVPALERRVPGHFKQVPPRTGTWGHTLSGLTVSPRPQTFRT